jgi:hypothetical protein
MTSNLPADVKERKEIYMYVISDSTLDVLRGSFTIMIYIIIYNAHIRNNIIIIIIIIAYIC